MTTNKTDYYYGVHIKDAYNTDDIQILIDAFRKAEALGIDPRIFGRFVTRYEFSFEVCAYLNRDDHKFRNPDVGDAVLWFKDMYLGAFHSIEDWEDGDWICTYSFVLDDKIHVFGDLPDREYALGE